jgi:hypothetical protein
MEVVEAEPAPRRDRRRSMLAAIREYLAGRTTALSAATVLVYFSLLSWNVLMQEQVQRLTAQVEQAQTAPSARFRRTGRSRSKARGPSRGPARR